MTSKNALVFHHYGDEFNTNSAEVLLPFILKMIKAKSLLDVGCGIGTWLKVFKEKGGLDILGLDGQHVEKYFLLDKKYLRNMDFEQETCFENLEKRKYDISFCLEVVEHLSAEAGKRMVEFLAKSSDFIVFSAAIPNQTGENHINEQFPAYWQQLFDKEGFTFYDPFRIPFWNNSKVEWWYRQNLFLLVKNGTKLDENLPLYQGDVRIHPEMLNMYTHLLQETEERNTRKIYKKFKSLFK